MSDHDREDRERLAKLIAEPPVLLVGPAGGTGRLREAVLAASRRGTPLVIIGTSGSTDYLRGSNDERRFWPVAVQAGQPARTPTEHSRGDLSSPQATRRDDDVDEEME